MLFRSQEMVTLQVRPGVTESFFIADMGGRGVEAVALLFSGGGGNIRLRLENGQPRFGAQNFLPRSRMEFIRNGILPVIVDNPSDQQAGAGMTDAFRQGEEHAADVRAIVAEMRRRRPGRLHRRPRRDPLHPRGEHPPRLHHRQHVPEAVGSQRGFLFRAGDAHRAHGEIPADRLSLFPRRARTGLLYCTLPHCAVILPSSTIFL